MDGFCIVFDTPALCQLLANEFDTHYWVYLQADAVRYAVDEMPLDDLFPKLVQAGAKTLEDFLLSGIRTPEMGIAEFLAGAALFKHQAFLEEREVRIVQLIGVTVFAAAEFAAVVGEHGVDLGCVRLKGPQHIIVDQLDGGDRQFVG